MDSDGPEPAWPLPDDESAGSAVVIVEGESDRAALETVALLAVV
ncbi:MAG TPA: hypothetical protein VFY91_00470 [Microbacterium sp.]|nr:hypothetical protein [Microbacterium sp.]